MRLISSAMAIAAVAVLLLVAAACSNDSSATPRPTPTAALTPTPGGTATPTPDATALAGAPITPSDAAAYLPARADENHVWAPIGGFGGFVIVGKEPDKSLGENAPWAYYVWNPADGSLAPEWTGEPGKPETVVDSYYDWIVTERRGAGGTASYGDWVVEARNLVTGESQEIARAGGAVGGPEPSPSIFFGEVAWVETVVGTASTTQRIQLHDIASGNTSTVIEVNTTTDTLWSPSFGGAKIAWLQQSAATDTTQIVVRDLGTAAPDKTFEVAQSASAVVMTKDGRYVSWSSSDGDKYLIDLSTGKTTLLGPGQGAGLYATTRYVSWDTANNKADEWLPSGLYDIQTGELRPLIPSEGVLTYTGRVMGNWFVWQAWQSGDPTLPDSKFYAMPLVAELTSGPPG